ncbi:MAG: ArnT family glycosyltransferase [Solirubrobacteraceae bacterium]
MDNGRWRYWGPLGVLLGVAFGLRLWGVKQGLPYVYDVDEYGHFVPEAVRIFGHGLNPHYFVNPPALTYLLHVVFGVWFGLLGASSHTSIARDFALHPERFFLVARVTVALLGTASVWLLYLVGARLFSRAIGLLASAVMAVAFLPVFYGRLALNDAPTLLPLTLSLLGTAGILRRGRRLDYLLAGLGLGLAAATKYTAGAVILPLLAAAAIQYRDARPGTAGGASADRGPERDGSPAERRGTERDGTPGTSRDVAIGLGIALLAALAAYLIANPYSLLDFHAFRAELELQSHYTGQSAASWIGGPGRGSLLYYLWSFTWGLGWIPALAALGGAVGVWRRDRRVGWVLVPVLLLYLLFLGLQGRYFGRWLLPIFPVACLLAASFALGCAGWAVRRIERLRAGRRPRVDPTTRRRSGRAGFAAVAITAVAVIALTAQGVVYSIHSGLVLSRADTRNLTRAWAVAHIPAGARIVLEPVVPNAWLDETAGDGTVYPRWVKFQALRVVLDPATGRPETGHRTVALEDYERTLSAPLVDYYERHGYCWVVSGYTQSGRALANPRLVPGAVGYYRELARRGEVAYHVSPYSSGSDHVAFNFDWTFDYYPLAFHRPGPEMTVYRLRGGTC